VPAPADFFLLPGEHFAEPYDAEEERERARSFKKCIEGLARIDRRYERKRRRAQVAEDIGVVKAARRAGLLVAKATVAGVDLELGEPTKTREAVPVTELDAWIGRHARSA
jgi:hypothetical protein